MNRVAERCKKDSFAKINFGSKRIYSELKLVKLFLYALNFIPVSLCFVQTGDNTLKLIVSLVSFGLTLFTEVLSAFINNHKEKAILLKQLYESEVTGSTFSKIEYDRESTNEIHELAIRKGVPALTKGKKIDVLEVPQVISDDYSYLYLCRKEAATTKFLLARVFYVYVTVLVVLALFLIAGTLQNKTTGESLYYIVCFWPLIMPIIKNCTASKKCIKQCIKISADIDNFFGDGDDSLERLARFYYYVQTIEYEMLLNKPTIYAMFYKIFHNGCSILNKGVTSRFIEAINELKSKSLLAKGYVNVPKSKNLITKVELDAQEILEKEKLRRARARRKAELEKLRKEEAKLEASKQVAKPVTTKASTSKSSSTRTSSTAKTTTPRATSTTSKTTSTPRTSTTARKTTATKPAIKSTTVKSTTTKPVSTRTRATTSSTNKK